MTRRGTATRCTWVGLVVLLVTLVGCDGSPGKRAATTSSGPASGRGPTEDVPRGYLALGDSAPFGFRLAAEAEYDDASDFVGYPQLLAEDYDLRLYDGSCPGETTGSFLDVDAVSNGCTNDRGSGEGYRGQYPLHADYDGSQLDYALAMLESDPDIGLVTVQLGANDAVLCLKTLPCLTAAGAATMVAQVRQHVDTALDALRVEGGYQGRILVVNYYANNYFDLLEVAGLRQLNAALASAASVHDATLVDAYAAFQAAATGAAGNSVAAGLVLSGDTHPSQEGQRLLARLIENAL